MSSVRSLTLPDVRWKMVGGKQIEGAPLLVVEVLSPSNW